MPAPPQGCSIPAPGFPSLHTRPLSPYIDMVNMHVFNRPSRLPSVVLRIGDGLMLSPDTWKDPNTPEMHEIYSPKFSVPYRMGTTVRVFKENMDPLRGGATCAMPMCEYHAHHAVHPTQQLSMFYPHLPSQEC